MTAPAVGDVPAEDRPTTTPGPDPARGWVPDVLGGDWVARTVPLTRGEPGSVATLVRHGSPARRRAVLHLHGYVDYFFQTHLADAWESMGYDFYALDLRAHGRSIRPGQLPNFVTDLAHHAEELDLAARTVRDEGHDVLVIHGHSTGGLLAALWADRRRGRPDGPAADALVLNSPWLELNRPWFDRVVTTRLVDLVGRFAPRLVVGQIGRHYGEWLQAADGGGWRYDLAWKPHEGFGVRAGWLRSVRRAHREVARGLDVDVPVLVCASGETGPYDREHDALDRTDSVLSVEHIVELGPRLGPDVTVAQVVGGVHDLALSPEPARSAYLEIVRDWVADRVP